VPSENIANLLRKTEGFRRLLLTTHRRESFGDKMSGNLMALRDFVLRHQDVCLLFPVHPNPNVRGVTNEILAGHAQIHLLEPLDYTDFICLMRYAWLIASDSGGVQEESPSMGKPVLILRENTERPEAVASGVAKLVGANGALAGMLEDNYRDETWINSVRSIANPFGDGHAARKIVDILEAAQRGANGNVRSKIADAK
jgi:UDP-N-acetylglucosamine 2-epimerase (non-hydrolysing)